MPDGPTETKAGAAEFTFITDDRTAHSQCDRVNNGQPKPATTGRPVTAGVKAYKRFKNLFAGVWSNTGTVIFHNQRRLIAIQ